MPTTTLLSGEILNVHCNSAMGLERSKLAQETKKYNIPFEDLRIFDSSSNAVLPNTASGSNLGLIIATNDFYVQTSNAGGTTVTQKMRFRWSVPAEYDAGQSLQLVFYGGMNTAVANGTATVDFAVYKTDPDTGLVGSDLSTTTAATTINSLTFSARAFDITATGIVNGDQLIAIMTIAITDSGTPTTLARMSKVYYSLAVKG